MERADLHIKDGLRTVTLTKGEAAFLRLCCQDIAYHSIARMMGKSPRTIDGHRDMLFYKLGVRSRTGLVLWAFLTGFVTVKDIHLRFNPAKEKAPPLIAGPPVHDT